ncbi:MAG TPA: lipopolysaccharide biosynthesis protein [Candidatus Binatia bacterium]|nr:lipopolysaccharide biosynthesis protein [Candidatus Binatia bacterium]
MTADATGLTHRTLQGMVWTASGVAVEAVLQSVVIAVLARLLMPADFGVVAMALVVTGFVAIFGELGLAPALVQRSRLEPAHIRTAFTGALALAAVVAAALWVLSPLAARVFGIPAVTPIVRVLGLSLLIKAWGAVPSALLQRAMRFRVLTAAGVLSYLIGFGAVGIGLAVGGAGPWALVTAQIVQALVYSVIVHVASPVSHRLALDARALRDLASYGLGASAARLANYLAVRGDNLVVGRALGATALGLYGPAYQLMALPADLFQRIVQSVLFPAAAHVQAEPARLAAAYRRGLAITGLSALPITGLTSLLAPEIVHTLLGPRWAGAIGPLQILAAGMFFRVGYKTSVVFVKAAGAVRPFAARQLAYPVLVLALASFGARWGLEGVAAGVVVALAVHYALLTTLGLRVAGLRLRDYFAAHGPALRLSVALVGQAWLAVTLMREAGSAPWVVLVVVATSTTLVGAGLFRRIPDHVLGAEGRWFCRSVARSLALARLGSGALARS